MLYDSHRQLFSIGYNLSEGRLDPSYYDLLASECRLASFLSIAKGDVPQEHWFRLGRALTQTGEGRALVSWSASMFEYMMPLLVMRDWPSTLLSETYDTVVRSQIDYGAHPGHPVGRERVRVQRQGLVAHLPVPGVRRPRARPEAGTVRRRGGRALRRDDRAADRRAPRWSTTSRPSRQRAPRVATATTRRSTTRPGVCRPASRERS